MSLRKIYPCCLLSGITPSAIINTEAFKWSAITRMLSFLRYFPVFFFTQLFNYFNNWIKGISEKNIGWLLTAALSRSSPPPKSTLCCFNSFRLPSDCFWYCIKTELPISINLRTGNSDGTSDFCKEIFRGALIQCQNHKGFAVRPSAHLLACFPAHQLYSPILRASYVKMRAPADEAWSVTVASIPTEANNSFQISMIPHLWEQIHFLQMPRYIIVRIKT